MEEDKEDKIILPTEPTAKPLYRRVVDRASDCTKYLIGYRSATLLPFPANEKDEGSLPNKNIPTELVDETESVIEGYVAAKSLWQG
jgi:hypothetical protein